MLSVEQMRNFKTKFSWNYTFYFCERKCPFRKVHLQFSNQLTCRLSGHTCSAPNFTTHYNTWTSARESSGCGHGASGDVKWPHHPPQRRILPWEFKITFMSEHRLCKPATFCYSGQVCAHTITQNNNAPVTSRAQAVSACSLLQPAVLTHLRVPRPRMHKL